MRRGLRRTRGKLPAIGHSGPGLHLTGDPTRDSRCSGWCRLSARGGAGTRRPGAGLDGAVRSRAEVLASQVREIGYVLQRNDPILLEPRQQIEVVRVVGGARELGKVHGGTRKSRGCRAAASGASRRRLRQRSIAVGGGGNWALVRLEKMGRRRRRVGWAASCRLIDVFVAV